MHSSARISGRQEGFSTTHWSLVLAAASASPESSPALEQLCRAYWYPLYAYVRRRGYTVHDAQDLTQEFFARLLENNYLAEAQRERGRFRSFLLASIKHFLANEWDRATAQKRGGRRTIVPLDDQEVEERYACELATSKPVEAFFDQRWALTIMRRALGALRDQFVSDGKAQQFDKLKRFLTDRGADADYPDVAAELNMKTGTVAVTIHRMRQRYRDLVRAEIAQTVSSPEELQEEMRYLLTVLSD